MPGMWDKPEEFRAYQTSLSQEGLNKLHNAITREIRGDGNTNVTYFGDRVVISNKEKPWIQHIVLQAFMVVEEYNDTLKCVMFDYTSDPQGLVTATGQLPSINYIIVAKPRILQLTPFDGKSLTTLGGIVISFAYDKTIIGQRVATISGSTNTQNISPGYFFGDIIIGRYAPTGITDFSLIPKFKAILSPDGLTLTFNNNDDTNNFSIGQIIQITSDTNIIILVTITNIDEFGVVTIGNPVGGNPANINNKIDVKPYSDGLVFWEDINEGARIWGGPSNTAENFGWVQREGSFGSGYDTTSNEGSGIQSSGNISFTDVDTGLSIVPGMVVIADGGGGNTMTGTVTYYGPGGSLGGQDLNFDITASTGNVGSSTWVITVIKDQYGNMPGKKYNRDFTYLKEIWIVDANSKLPDASVFEMAFRKLTDYKGKEVWATRIRGPVVTGVVCDSNGNIKGIFGNAP